MNFPTFSYLSILEVNESFLQCNNLYDGFGVHHETGAKYAFCVQQKKEDFTPVYWLRWQQVIWLKYSFLEEKEDFSQIVKRHLRIVPQPLYKGYASYYLCTRKMIMTSFRIDCKSDRKISWWLRAERDAIPCWKDSLHSYP